MEIEAKRVNWWEIKEDFHTEFLDEIHIINNMVINTDQHSKKQLRERLTILYSALEELLKEEDDPLWWMTQSGIMLQRNPLQKAYNLLFSKRKAGNSNFFLQKS